MREELRTGVHTSFLKRRQLGSFVLRAELVDSSATPSPRAGNQVMLRTSLHNFSIGEL